MNSQKRQCPLELDTRRRIYTYILENPGTHLRAIIRGLGMATGMVEYHISYMVKQDIIVEKDEGGYKRYYAGRKFDYISRGILAALRCEIPRGILLFLLEKGKCQHKEILSSFSITGATLSYHLRRLEKEGIIKSEKKGRERYYYLTYPDRVRDLLITYRQSFFDALVDKFVEVFGT